MKVAGMKLRLFAALLTVPYLVGGIAFIMLSGSAEGYTTPRAVFLLLLPIGFIQVLVIAARSIWKLNQRRPVFSKSAVAAVVSPIAFFLCMVAGFGIDERALTETKLRGDDIVKRLEIFTAETGTCPNDIASLYPNGTAAPKPALKNANFSLSVRASNCFVGFPAYTFLYCTKASTDEEWFCYS